MAEENFEIQVPKPRFFNSKFNLAEFEVVEPFEVSEEFQMEEWY